MEALLISACLLGSACKYSGGSNALPEDCLESLRRRYRLIPVCPEVAGGLPVPREPSERRGGRVVSRTGEDVTEAFRRGAETALLLARRFGCRRALLKAGSPSCGKDRIYDGSFTGTVIPGSGVTAQIIMQENVIVYSEKDTAFFEENGEIL